MNPPSPGALWLQVASLAGLAVAAGVLLWILARLWKARAAVARALDPQGAEAALRVQAERLLATRLARGEIERATYERALEKLWGIDVPPRPAGGPSGSPDSAVPPGPRGDLPAS